VSDGAAGRTPAIQAEARRIADELRGVAAFGLNFARPGSFDEERWQHVLAAAARLAALNGDGAAGDLLAQYQANHFDIGPVASGEAAVFHDGRLLLIRRSDDGLWALPGGITDPGETLARTAQRELWEEAGLAGRVVELLGVFDSRLWQSEKRIHFYHAVFRIEVDDPQPRPTAESTAAAYFAAGELPPLSPGHHLRAPFVLRQLRGDAPRPYFDPPEE
jgi:ADP-ribose pyrophosphatase YjhB (NUDIX family)